MDRSLLYCPGAPSGPSTFPNTLDLTHFFDRVRHTMSQKALNRTRLIKSGNWGSVRHFLWGRIWSLLFRKSQIQPNPDLFKRFILQIIKVTSQVTEVFVTESVTEIRLADLHKAQQNDSVGLIWHFRGIISLTKPYNYVLVLILSLRCNKNRNVHLTDFKGRLKCNWISTIGEWS